MKFLTGFLLLFLALFISCKNNKTKNEKVVALPMGNWKMIELKTAQKNIILDTIITYILEHYLKNKIEIVAEDNALKGEIVPINKNTFIFKRIQITDVCCNSKAAKLVFDFFKDTIKYEERTDTLILSTHKMILTLKKQNIE